MDTNRRRIIKAGLIGGASLTAGSLPVSATAMKNAVAEKPLNILVLGGTGFIGPHMVREALRRGHSVSLFNRGRTNSNLFPDLDLYVGDRNNGLESLEGHRWDAVVDNSGYVPRHVADSARLLSPAVDRYVFISSISAYASFRQPNVEDSPLATMSDESVEEVTGETYGPMKALCEQRAAKILGDKLTVLRPTYVCGPGDGTDRFSYWPIRTAKGGEMLWPGDRSDAIQIVDVRDLANFTIDCIESDIAGTYNTVTPAGDYTIGELHDDCVAVSGTPMRSTWVDSAFVDAQGLADGRSLPIWSPPTGEYANVARVSGEKAAAAGLRNRPVRETARDTLTWWATLPEARTSSVRAGLGAEREAELLALWGTQAGQN